MRPALICVLAHRHALVPLFSLILFSPFLARLVRCCALLSLVIALTRARVWYPFRAHTLRSHSEAILVPAHSLLSCVTQYRNGIYTSVVLFTLKTHAVQKGTN